VQKLKFHGEEQSFLSDFLLRISAAGIFVYSAFNVIAGGLGIHSDLKNILVMAVGGITIVQVRKAMLKNSIFINRAFLKKVCYVPIKSWLLYFHSISGYITALVYF